MIRKSKTRPGSAPTVKPPDVTDPVLNRREMRRLCSTLARLRWSRIPVAERSRQVPHNGGRKSLYPPCPRYGSHRFGRKSKCPCGYIRNLTKEPA